ncbi:MAG: hypothetical protein A3E36_03910 [Candidatus Andersenbacteria bacterium RIFCSPHIGHO2_12_FULL_45_11b]|uniref:Uncharacterized protein n=1 Tax=Candidatus Andersenbacteria bacterium RIFCSPHIGHO2_12_FULL_45_11b TaxID=1797282 RepID=A0A1G1X9N7_9BACT|nr:MAG: hypothetical protein A3E36_03910 [Candidatus Andersenbacteria bacterium RIFCSPHIGHO2_12_FULL_45_11b]
MIPQNSPREIFWLMALIAGFSVALLVLPDAPKEPAAPSAAVVLPVAEKGATVEKITVPAHTIFAL